MKNLIKLVLLLGLSNLIFGVTIEKELKFDKYTLNDTYKYEKTSRKFQWDKISEDLDKLEKFQSENTSLGFLKNYKNRSGQPPIPKVFKNNKYEVTITIKEPVDPVLTEGAIPKTEKKIYEIITDENKIRQYQGIPLYSADDRTAPERYALDGSLIAILPSEEISDFVKIKVFSFEGEWFVPKKYVDDFPVTASFDLKKVIFIDRKNQNIATIEKSDDVWKVRSMNPVTTGLDAPPFQFPTPLGTFLIQGKSQVVPYATDGYSSKIAGNFYYGMRFSGGAYMHGIPVDLPRTEPIEYSETLGSTARSHMCVRNATSHAKYMFYWAETLKTVVFVIE